ncbi:protein TIFY 8-like isoform X2 [Tripterygium wilfordii]|uniref:protein TIFY 8-like isoform X2 n=1 Tax=Tripterygium wilfordii TaxID=458696 RepID=UPI0018F8533A|nr:protein TIFY 8-like isoform X2 [Tripterygium wilfordii]
MAGLIMAQPNKIYNAIGARDLISMSGTGTDNKTLGQQLQQKEQGKPMLHDFLGMKVGIDSSVVLTPKTGEARVAEASPSASASLGGSSGGGRGPISTTSDLGSERQVGEHLEGVPFYGPRSDVSRHDINNRLAGNKRSNSDSTFMGSSSERIPQMGHDSIESSHLMKMLRNGAGGERPRRSSDDEVLHGMQSLKPTSSLILQPPTGNRFDANAAKWERSIPMGPLMQYPLRGSQFVPFMQQVPSNRFKDAHTGSTIISQSAADEGSRTGIKGPGILSSLKAGGSVSDNNSTGTLLSGSRAKSGIHVSEPESSTPNRQGLMSASRQMTIFYGGQAHVFDDVHPNKADVIMALAGSNGGSWSTTYSPKSTGRPASDDRMSRGEYETCIAGNAAFPREFHGRLSGTSNAAQDTGSGDRVPAPTGGHQGGVTIAKAKESGTEDKRERQS